MIASDEKVSPAVNGSDPWRDDWIEKMTKQDKGANIVGMNAFSVSGKFCP
jgi:hypothetical protein